MRVPENPSGTSGLDTVAFETVSSNGSTYAQTAATSSTTTATRTTARTRDVRRLGTRRGVLVKGESDSLEFGGPGVTRTRYHLGGLGHVARGAFV